MRSETIGMLGGIVGSAVGLLGGIVGTYFSIKNTHGPRERAFAIQASVLAWIYLALFIGALLLLPPSQRLWPWLSYVVVLPLGIRAWNRKQSRIRQEESGRSA